jgi:cytochrome c oxidase assembly protein subunit 11
MSRSPGMTPEEARTRQRKHTRLLLLLAAGMFGFAFALVPLYEVFCELTGVNGKTAGRTTATVQSLLLEAKDTEATDRQVTLQFFAQVGNGLPWEFRPMERQMRIQPGKSYSTRFYVRNRASQAVTGRAVPSVSPGVAALHLHKTECFCFRQQRLEAGESMEMPVTFIVDSELPKEIQTFSLSYTLFRADEQQVSAVDRPADETAQGATSPSDKIGADG